MRFHAKNDQLFRVIAVSGAKNDLERVGGKDNEKLAAREANSLNISSMCLGGFEDSETLSYGYITFRGSTCPKFKAYYPQLGR